MKHSLVVVIALIVVILGALVWLIVQQTIPAPQTTTVISSNVSAGQNVAVAGVNVNSADRIVRGPYPKDADGCTVIDLRGKPPTTHDAEKRVYTWIVEHPADESCVRQTPPTITETVKETKNEKIPGTNNWEYDIFYE